MILSSRILSIFSFFSVSWVRSLELDEFWDLKDLVILLCWLLENLTVDEFFIL